MDDDQPKRSDTDNERATDDLDTSAILARRKMFVASALAGMSLGAASCEAQVSGSVSAGGGANSGGSGAVATPVGGGGSGSSGDQGTVVAQPCLMVAATPEDSGASRYTELDAGTVIVAPCLQVASPEFLDSGVRADARSDARGQPANPQIGVSMPCLSIPAPQRDAGRPISLGPNVCLSFRVPEDAGVADARAVDASTGAVVRDAGVRVPTPQPCLEMAVPRPCLRYANPPRTVPQPCLTPVRGPKGDDAAHEFKDAADGADSAEDE